MTGSLRRSESINELATALAKAQAAMRHAQKDATNPHFKSKYADLASVLEAIREPFAANGLSLSQHPSGDADRITLTTILLHQSGQYLESDLSVTPAQKTPQGAGSAITYMRRYTAMAVAGLAADDDDGNAASPPPRNDQRPPETRPAPAQTQGGYDDDNDSHRRVLIGLAQRQGLRDGKQIMELRRLCADTPFDNIERAVTAFVAKQKGAPPA